MTFKKKMMVTAAACALTATAAVPAMALENDFHGMYRLRAFLTNYSIGGALAKDALTQSVFEQRARILYTAKANDDLKLVTHFEIDSSFGDSAYANGRGLGGAIGADTVNLETKNVYLDFNIPSTPVNAKVGIQGFNDAYKGIFVTDDMAGVLLTAKLQPATVTGGFFRLDDAAGTGRASRDLYVLDAKYAMNKDLTLGGAYYVVRDDRTFNTLNTQMLGINAAANVGPVALDAFLAYQFGEVAANRDLGAYALQVAGKGKLGIGTARAAVLYASGEKTPTVGDSSAFQSINSTSTAGAAVSSNSYYSGDMLILMRSKWAMDSDRALIATTNNANQGLMGAFLGYDAKVTDKLSATANAGFAWVATRNTTTASTSKFVGTELNAQFNYSVYTNLNASLQTAVVLLGDYYKGTATGGKDPDNPYMTALMLNYTF